MSSYTGKCDRSRLCQAILSGTSSCSRVCGQTTVSLHRASNRPPCQGTGAVIERSLHLGHQFVLPIFVRDASIFGRTPAGDAGAHKAIRNADVRHQVCKCHLLRCGTKTIVIGRHLFCRCGQILGLQLKPGARSIGHWTGQSLRIRRLRQQRTGQ